MPFRPPRLTVRRLMIVVALVAVAIGGTLEAIRLSRRSWYYSSQVWFHRMHEDSARNSAKQSHRDWLASRRATQELNVELDILLGEIYPPRDLPPPPDVQRELAEYHRRLREKYERAARYPWLSVEPDPPEPAWDGIVRP